MLFLIPLSVILAFSGQVAAVCQPNAEQCASVRNSSNCIAVGYSEEIECVSYTCKYNNFIGHAIQELDDNQVERCMINGDCYGVGYGPDSCTKCMTDNGLTFVEPGCKKDEECIPDGAEFQDGCVTLICHSTNNVVTLDFAGTVGCQLDEQCYQAGTRMDAPTRLNCQTCSLDIIEAIQYHQWMRTCFDPRNKQCHNEGSMIDVGCTSFICGNRGGIGWFRHDVSSCQVSPNDCVPLNSVSPRNGFCYFCDDAEQDPDVGCRMCDKCLREGESAYCDGDVQFCGATTDPPTEGDIICKVGGDTLEVDDTTFDEFGCNKYMCTQYGPIQTSSNCIYLDKCYRRGEMIDEANCVQCVAGGDFPEAQQGCPYNGKCYQLGQSIRIGCVVKECSLQNGRLKFIKSEYQPTPCSCTGQCYPVGKIAYHPSLCAECLPNGKVEYACKLSSGQCLRDGEEESIPASGCYRMRCRHDKSKSTFFIERVPGQTYTCLLSNGMCLEEPGSQIVDGVTYVCLSKDTCFINNMPVHVGESMAVKCNVFECQETIVGGETRALPFTMEHGCEYADTCKALEEEYEMNCHLYKCVKNEDGSAGISELVKERCTCDGHCIEIGDYYFDSNCNKRECQGNLTMHLVDTGCKSALHPNLCLEKGESITIGDEKETCKADGSTEVGGGDPHHTDCLNWYNEVVPYGVTYATDCNNYICEVRGQSFGLFLVGEKRCTIYVDGNLMCLSDGETENCHECLADGKFKSKCTGDGGACVEPDGNLVDYKCGTARCDPITFQMKEEPPHQCNFNGICVSGPTWVIHQSVPIMVFCESPAKNAMRVHQPTPE